MDIRLSSRFFLLNNTLTTEIGTLSLHDALPIYCEHGERRLYLGGRVKVLAAEPDLCIVLALARSRVSKLALELVDRKSTRLNSSHANISYAVFCLKKKRLTTGAGNGQTRPAPDG